MTRVNVPSALGRGFQPVDSIDKSILLLKAGVTKGQSPKFNFGFSNFMIGNLN